MSSSPLAATATAAAAAATTTEQRSMSDLPEGDDPRTPPQKAMLTREDSLCEDGGNGLPALKEDLELADYERADDGSSKNRYDTEDALNLPPGRMHATRVPERLSGSGNIKASNLPASSFASDSALPIGPSAPAAGGSLQIPPKLNNILRKQKERGGSPYSPRSRSRSPALNPEAVSKGLGAGATATTFDANSSISSLEDIVDQDILYDRAGFVELDSEQIHKKFTSAGSGLPPVNERMTEDTLEDVHAFSDVVKSSNASRANSIATPGEYLEPLNECDDERSSIDDLDQIDEEDDDGPGGNGIDSDGIATTRIIVTNLDNLAIGEHHNGDGQPNAGDDSAAVQGTSQAPSVPTA